MQIITIPFAFLVQFKAAWLSCYLFGFIVNKRQCSMINMDNNINRHKYIKEKFIIYILALIGLLYRVCNYKFLGYLYGIKEAVNSLIIQYITCIQGVALTLIIIEICNNKQIKRILEEHSTVTGLICKYSYAIYLVQGFFCDIIFTKYLSLNISLNILLIISFVIISSVCLFWVSNYFQKKLINKLSL